MAPFHLFMEWKILWNTRLMFNRLRLRPRTVHVHAWCCTPAQQMNHANLKTQTLIMDPFHWVSGLQPMQHTLVYLHCYLFAFNEKRYNISTQQPHHESAIFRCCVIASYLAIWRHLGSPLCVNTPLSVGWRLKAEVMAWKQYVRSKVRRKLARG